MSATRQWSHGLQWGASTWLAYVAVRAVSRAVHVPSAAYVVVAVGWITALAFIAAGSRWSRGVVVAAIFAQAATGYASATDYGSPPSAPFALLFFLPMCLPLLPLVVLPVEQPRIALALIGLGRWREARSMLGGVGPLLVAAALVTLNRGAVDLCVHLQHEQGWMATAWWVPAGLFVVAASVIAATSRRGPAAATT
jgi:hypothetical protein